MSGGAGAQPPAAGQIDAFVVAHGQEPGLAATLEGLTGQTLRVNRLVVAFNAPAGQSLATAERYGARLPLELVAYPDNRGFAAAANEALRRTSAPWVLSLNPDCRLAPDFLERLSPARSGPGRIGAASGLLMRATGEALAASRSVDSAGMVMTVAGRHFDRGAGRPLSPGLLRPAWVFGASAAAALYRREALDDVAYPGGEVFDETFFAYREDADLAWRLQRRGWRCLYEPAARAFHARGLKPEARRRGSPEINRHSVRNRFLLRWGNADWRWLLACFPFWLLRDLTVAAACLTVERSSLPGLAEAWTLRRAQRARGRRNAARAAVSGWEVAAWFLPGRRVREARS